jgi:riboflavin kinase/FMN adenylyltransferase
MNIGVRPTFGAGDPVIEAHLIDFDGDIYGHDLVVELSHYLRPEIQYGDVEELIRQIRADVEAARGLIDLPPGAG